ncbi:MAG: ParB N-terminal domain-containing protein [Acidobacteria bacterium]|nr:ParB N-terminal domain-containing protein [Acidobacteriota bacterium]
MQIETWHIGKVKPYVRNARRIPEKAIAKVATSLAQFGWKQPLVVDPQGVVIVGHTRLAAAKKLGWNEVPVLVAADLSPAQVKAYRLMDNRSHDETAWDLDILPLEMADLKLEGLDLTLTGFDLPQIEGFLQAASTPGADADAAAPEPPANPVSKRGDIWILGAHRVMCGSSTDELDVRDLLAGAKPNLMVTDPPYGVEYDPKWREDYDQFKRHAVGKVANDDRADWADAYRLFPGDVAYVWHAGVYAADVSAGLIATSFEIRAQIIWRKQHFVFGRGAYHWGHEPCWYAVRKGGKANWLGDRKQTTVWDVANLHPMGGNKTEKPTGHGTQKPVELMRRPIVNHTKRGDAVYDPFLGSGTTLIAAQELERICYGLEIDPRYCDAIVQRWQTFTGKTAGLAEDGRTFDQVAYDRTEAIAA